MAYDIKRLIRQKGIRRKIVLPRQIEMAAALEDDLLAIAMQVVEFWRRAAKERIMPAYDAALDQVIRDDALDGLQQALSLTVSESGTVTAGLSDQVRTWLARVLSWHTSRWVASIRAASGVDVYPLLDLRANDAALRAFRDRVSSLISNLSDQARKDISERVWAGVLNKTPRRVIAKEITADVPAVWRTRAKLIAVDQANKVNSEFTRIRQQEAGIDQFVWETARDDRVRPSHRALQGKIFAWDAPPSIGLPGTPIRCRCTGRAYIDLEAED